MNELLDDDDISQLDEYESAGSKVDYPLVVLKAYHDFLLYGVADLPPAQQMLILERLRQFHHDLKDKYATHDHLTYLPTRSVLAEGLLLLANQAERQGNHLTVYEIDINYLKIVNDNYGHAKGDEVLKRLMRGVASRLRKSDIFGRLGGDEFGGGGFGQDPKRSKSGFLVHEVKVASQILMAAETERIVLQTLWSTDLPAACDRSLLPQIGTIAVGLETVFSEQLSPTLAEIYASKEPDQGIIEYFENLTDTKMYLAKKRAHQINQSCAALTNRAGDIQIFTLDEIKQEWESKELD